MAGNEKPISTVVVKVEGVDTALEQITIDSQCIPKKHFIKVKALIESAEYEIWAPLLF